MNGSAHKKPTAMDIQLKRGPAGLGFNIVGGIDRPFIAHDNSIYVSKIKEDGAAALDGRLQEGDKIIAINGESLEDMTHLSVVDLFRSAGEDVVLSVVQMPTNILNGPVNPHPERDSSWSVSLLAVSGIVLAVALTAFVLYNRTGTLKRHHTF